jgi:hypothetical protein
MVGIDETKQSIRARLKDGPCWTRSFQNVKPILDMMIEDGEVLRCKPPGGRANNMVCLSGKPPGAPSMRLLDHFAERLAEHGSVSMAAASLSKSAWWGWQQFDEIRRRLGPQAR